jgi:hypothetical protein
MKITNSDAIQEGDFSGRILGWGDNNLASSEFKERAVRFRRIGIALRQMLGRPTRLAVVSEERNLVSPY